MKRTIIAALLTVVLAACGGDAELPSADPDVSATSDKDGGKSRGRGSNDKRSNGDDKKGPDGKDDGPGKGGGDSPEDDGPGSDGGDNPSDDGDDPGDNGSTDPAVTEGRSVVSEPTPDARKEGTTPAYAEIIEASITGLGSDFRMQMTMNGELPDRMPTPTTYMIVQFAIYTQEDEYSFFAMARSTGWTAYSGGKNDPDEFEGRFEIDGNVLILETPWSEIGGAQRFRWSSTSSWVSSVAGVSNYSFDRAPNKGQARYPE